MSPPYMFCPKGKTYMVDKIEGFKGKHRCFARKARETPVCPFIYMEYGRGDKLYGFGRQNGPIRNKQQYNPRNINSEEDFQEIMQREFDHEKELLGITGEKGLSDQYIMLDSFKKNPNSRVDQGEFIFDLAIQGSTGENVIGVRDKLDNIVK